jgi:hypothetical protein
MMTKFLVTAVITITVFVLTLVYGGSYVVNSIIDIIEPAKDWVGTVKVILWIVLFKVILFVSTLISVVIFAVINSAKIK